MKNFRAIFLATLAALPFGCAKDHTMPRGNDQTLQSIAGEMRFTNEDLAKRVRMRMRQKLLISLADDPLVTGTWTVKSVDRQKFILLDRFVRGESGLNSVWLYEARAYGDFTMKLVYTPADGTTPPKEFDVPVDILRTE